MNLIKSLISEIQAIDDLKTYGSVVSLKGMLIAVKITSKAASIGSLCKIQLSLSDERAGEIVGFEDDLALVMSYGGTVGIYPGARVLIENKPPTLFPHESWLGRVLNGFGEPMDSKGRLENGELPMPLYAEPLPARARGRVKDRMDVGVKAINTFMTLCKGQRLGIFSGSGVGKSMLLSMLARGTDCDVCVIGLIGERGREVNEFIEETLGPDGLAKSIIIVATSDDSALIRRRAAYATMTVTEYFRNQGKSVLCLFDSVTRFAMAQREIGLSVGEPPTTKGYTPSVFAELPKLLERAGPGVGENHGHTSAFFTVLVEGDDSNEPIADTVRGILDGHIVLERALAERSHFPAINVSRSLSRMVPMCLSEAEYETVKKARQLLSTFEDMQDMIRIGAYKAGSNPLVDEAIKYVPKIMDFLSQDWHKTSILEEDFAALNKLLNQVESENKN
jgi:flagellum-specific ATP synthase